VVNYEKGMCLVPLCSVQSVYSVVPARKITTDYTENTEKTRIRKAQISDLHSVAFALHRRELQTEPLREILESHQQN